MNQSTELIIRKQEIVLEVADLLRNLRRDKKLKQKFVAEQVGVKRQVLSKLENGQREQVDLVQLAEIVNTYGEELIVTTGSQSKESLINTEEEDLVLIAFSEGRIEEAEDLLEPLRHWHYPFHRIEARCKRDMAIAISYHFKGAVSRSYTLMNDIVMGLALLKCKDETLHLIEIYQRITKEGEEAFEREEALC